MTSAPNIGEAADALSEALKRAERAIASMRFCVRAAVPLGDAYAGRLAFGKLGGQWCLFVAWADGSEGPLLSQPFVIRLRAAGAIPELVAELRRVSLEQCEEMRRAACELNAYLDAHHALDSEGS